MAKLLNMAIALPIHRIVCRTDQRTRGAEFSAGLEFEFRDKVDAKLHALPEQASRVAAELIQSPGSRCAGNDYPHHDQIRTLLNELILPCPFRTVVEDLVYEFIRMNQASIRHRKIIDHSSLNRADGRNR